LVGSSSSLYTQRCFAAHLSLLRPPTPYAEHVAGVAVVTDSTASLDPQLALAAGVTIIPLQVVIDDVSRPESEVEPVEVARALRAGRRVTTSRPSVDLISRTYAELAAAGHEAIVSVHLSAHISGTYAAAELAAQSSPVPVTVVDSTTLAMATGFAVLSAGEAAAAGRDGPSVAEVARRRAAAATTYFYVEDLRYLRRSGRIGPAAAVLGSALAVKPLLTVAGGEIRAYERVRTESKALARLEELGLAALARAAGESDHVDVAVHHLDSLAAADRLVDRLRGRVTTTGDILVAEMSAVLGVHVGPGTLGVVVSPRI
jgi:DegV family protein with EDD domain